MEDLLQKLTLEEKAALLQGKTAWRTQDIPRLGIPSLFVADGPHGMRRQVSKKEQVGHSKSLPATCFPTAAAMANSWDEDLGRRLGHALGEEAAAQGVGIVLGPGLNIKRSPLCGRNFEYFSEDPYLAGKMAAAYIKGIQETGVGACPKHFAANSQELRRQSVDSVVDERTLREIYLTGFEIAVKEGRPKAIMTGYNLVNGTYANENKHLITDILRRSWGFDGLIMSDWGGDNDHIAGVSAGSDLVMPNPGMSCAQALVEAVKKGEISESVLDDRLRELLPVVFSCTQASQSAGGFDAAAHHALARECAEKSIVLLENDGILPLKAGAKIAVVGDFAKRPRYQGAGSSLVNPTRLDNLWDALKETYPDAVFAQGYRRGQAPDKALESQASDACREADAVLLCIGLDETGEAEGRDRSHLELPKNQQSLLAALCASDPHVVLVLSGGAPFVIPPCRCRAVIHGYLGGQAGARAMARALTGKINPGGKLAESWPLALEDTPCYGYFPGREKTAEYREGLFVGYRYYDTARVPVRWPFGYGKSYSNFAYSRLNVAGNQVNFTITNTSLRPGSEIAQVYVSCVDSGVYRPAKELKGFAKVHLESGERKAVTVTLDDKAFRYFDIRGGCFREEGGSYDILVGASVSDIRLRCRITRPGEKAEEEPLPGYRSGHIQAVSDEEFARLLGRPIPESRWGEEIGINDALSRLETAPSPAARLIYKGLKRRLAKAERSGKVDSTALYLYNMPIRAVAKSAARHISPQMAQDFLELCNGKTIRGACKMAVDFVKNEMLTRSYKRKLKK